jgi:acyl-coenzyme A synthetase/AMP-(fatty) acid ligase
VGRNDDVFKRKGQWVIPLEIESVVPHTLIRECALVRCVDHWGLPLATLFVVPAKPCADQRALSAAIMRDLKSSLPGYKLPDDVVVIGELPRSHNGKIQRFRLRELYASVS